MNRAPSWPTYSGPDDLPHIESIPLVDNIFPNTTYEIAQRAAQQWPERVGLTHLRSGADYLDPESTWTYGDLFDRVNRIAWTLRLEGMGRDDVAILFAKNCSDYIPALIASEAVGIAAPINPALSVSHVIEMLRDVRPTVLFAAAPEVDAEGWSAALEIARALPTIRSVLALGTAETLAPLPNPVPPSIFQTSRLSDALTAAPATPLAESDRPTGADVAAFIHTGGTTGLPKLAVHTHAQQSTNAWLLAIDGSLDAALPSFAALPLFHVNALIVSTLAPMLRGQPTVWGGPDGFRDISLYASFWKIVEHYRISTFSAVPTVYSVLANIPVDADISTLALAIVGAAPLPQTVLAAFESHTCVPLSEGYGLTEATCAVTRNFPTMPRPGSVGLRLPYVEVKVIDPAAPSRTVETGAVGEVAVRGPIVFPGYARFRKDTPGYTIESTDVDEDGWLHTGDLGRIGAGGYLYLTGRVKDVIIRGGHNIDPGLIEEAMRNHPAVHDACAVGRPDARSGEVPVCFVVTSLPDDAETKQQLLDFAAGQIPEPAAIPKDIFPIGGIPLTTLGKPDRKALRSRL